MREVLGLGVVGLVLYAGYTMLNNHGDEAGAEPYIKYISGAGSGYTAPTPQVLEQPKIVLNVESEKLYIPKKDQVKRKKSHSSSGVSFQQYVAETALKTAERTGGIGMSTERGYEIIDKSGGKIVYDMKKQQSYYESPIDVIKKAATPGLDDIVSDIREGKDEKSKPKKEQNKDEGSWFSGVVNSISDFISGLF